MGASCLPVARNVCACRIAVLIRLGCVSRRARGKVGLSVSVAEAVLLTFDHQRCHQCLLEVHNIRTDEGVQRLHPSIPDCGAR